MTMSKLTLSADRDLIGRAKKLAAAEGTSLSAMVSRLLRAMMRARESGDEAGPLTRQATALIRLPSRPGDKRLLEEALVEKYGIRK
jgi:hypothetical protein